MKYTKQINFILGFGLNLWISFGLLFLIAFAIPPILTEIILTQNNIFGTIASIGISLGCVFLIGFPILTKYPAKLVINF